MSLKQSGSGTQCVWNTVGLEQCVWNTVYLEHHGSGTQWVWNSMGMEHKEVKMSWSVAAEFSVMPG